MTLDLLDVVILHSVFPQPLLPEDVKMKFENIHNDMKSCLHKQLLSLNQRLLQLHTAPMQSTTLCSPRLIAKCTVMMEEMELVNKEINDVYATGAVEGYDSSP